MLKMKSKYSIQSIIQHTGMVNGGHYYTLCRDEKERQWYKYDDSTIKKHCEEKKDIISQENYLLFYRKKDPDEGTPKKTLKSKKKGKR